MKTINPNKLLETKVRIYDSSLLKELKDYYEKHTKSFKNKNEYYNFLIIQGISILKKEDKDAEYYYKQSKTLEEKFEELINLMKVANENIKNIDRGNFISLQENKTLLARIYNILLNSNKDLDRRFYDGGLYDDLPEEFKETTKIYENLYDYNGKS